MALTIPHIEDKTLETLHQFYTQLKQKKHMAAKVASENNRPTVMVVGAGVSGLCAANELTKLGFNVILVDARDRIGGRIHSIELENGRFIELGAHFMHGIKDNPIYNLHEKYKIEIKPYANNEWAVYDIEGNKLNKNKLTSLVKEYEHIIRTLSIERQSDTKDRFTAEEIQSIDLDKLKQKIKNSDDLEKIIKMINLEKINKETFFHYKLGVNKKEHESNYLVINGYIKLLEGLLKEANHTGLLTVRLSTEITKIDHSSYEIVAHTKEGEMIHADAMICTLPLGVLKNGNVKFDPLLPKAKMAAINTLKMAVLNKVILEFDRVFWDNLSHFVVLYDPTLNSWLDILNLQFFNTQTTPIFMSSIYTNDSNYNLPEDKYIVNHFVNLLKRIYPHSFRLLKNYWITHWDEDPFSFGSFSYHPKETSLDDNTEIARPIGRLIFAGEHTHRAPSNIQAAYLSGLESTVQVVDQLYHLFEAAMHE